MNELSIEQKSKRYNEALEIARAEYKNHESFNRFREMLLRIFPELEEDKDERIKEELMQYLWDLHHKDFVPLTPDIPTCDKWIAWLEKQGEQKHADTSCLLSWTENEEKMLRHLEGIVKDYWAKAEQENDEIRIKEASDVSYFLKTTQKSPLCWIECSNELPNKDGIYLVVTDGRYNDVYDMARYDSIEGWHKASEIIYWMPIPQPPKEV